MAVKLIDAGGVRMLTVMFGGTSEFECVLFTDTLAVTDNGVAVNHTEAFGGGYASKTLTGTPVVALVGGIPTVTFPQVTFEFTGPLTTNLDIRGYEVVEISSGITIFEEVFANAVRPIAGDLLPIIPRCQLGNGVPL